MLDEIGVQRQQIPAEARRRARWLAVSLQGTMVVSLIALFAWHPNPPQSEILLVLIYMVPLLPFLAYLGLVIQVRWLARKYGLRFDDVPRSSQWQLSLLGPLGYAWTVFVLTRANPRPDRADTDRNDLRG